MRVIVVGMGFVGLTSAVCFASRGFEVFGIDVDQERVSLLSNGKSPFYEKGLSAKLRKALKSKNLFFHTSLKDTPESTLTFITVGTPSKEDGSANLSFVEAAANSIGNKIRDSDNFQVVVVKSTVPPGTTLNVVLPRIEQTSRKQQGRDFGICANPEFLREGNAVADTLNPDRVVIGTADPKTRQIMRNFYGMFYQPKKIPIIEANPQTAELIKYANNSFLATKISFINTIANICQKIPGTDVEVVAKGIGLDKRINPLFLKAGLGYGGSCFPKDVTAIISIAEKHGYSPDLLKDTHRINQLQPNKAIQLLKKSLPDLLGKTISILGLSFKPDTSDMREAVSLKIIKELTRSGAMVKVHDPMALDEARKIFGNSVVYSSSIKDCLSDSDACIIVTEWKQYSKLTPQVFKKCMKRSIIIDGRRILVPEKFVGSVDSFTALGRTEQM
jgi:UDPglucose 6-dehydrogenase